MKTPSPEKEAQVFPECLSRSLKASVYRAQKVAPGLPVAWSEMGHRISGHRWERRTWTFRAERVHLNNHRGGRPPVRGEEGGGSLTTTHKSPNVHPSEELHRSGPWPADTPSARWKARRSREGV